jgi:penicillin-binding protein 2
MGFGRRSGVDLPGEAAGTLPTPDTISGLESHPWRTADTLELCIGQGSLTATPLQVARVLAAVANGGRLVHPHLASGLGLPQSYPREAEAKEAAGDSLAAAAPDEVAGLGASTLKTLDASLRAVVDDPRGSAYATVRLDSTAIAGKTGTAQTGAGRADHAWFAGYAPAARPRVAFVVVIEHGGNGSTAAGPVAKRLVQQMQSLGLLGPEQTPTEPRAE